MTATGQNLKRLLQQRGWGRHPFPVEAMAMIPPNREKENFPGCVLLKSDRPWVAVASLLSYEAIGVFFAPLLNRFPLVIIVYLTFHLDVYSRCSVDFCLSSLISPFFMGFFEWQAQVLS